LKEKYYIIKSNMEKNILLTIEYDGSEFSGWQKQPDRPTVQGYLEKVLSDLLKREIALSGTSRTDAGVHARGQKASFRTDINIPTERLALVINNILCGHEKGAFALSPVKIVSAEERPLDFHARFDSKGKKYIYRIRNSKETDIFMRNYMYHVAAPLDMDAMKTAAGYIVGTHDFKSFEASGGTPRETTVRTIFDIDIKENIYRIDNVNDGDIGRDIELHVSGDGFLYNMVRIITGTLVDIGTGRIPLYDMKKILEAKNRSKAGHTAPPYGLYLAEVYY
jgi:tRNA pseudouridine38-40 synthase